MHSVCGLLEGPHIDVLMTLAKNNSANQNISKITQKMQYWGVVSEGRLLIFRHFGDKDPKLVVPLETVSIKRGDKPGGRNQAFAKVRARVRERAFESVRALLFAASTNPNQLLSAGRGDLAHGDYKKTVGLREEAVNDGDLGR
jgi:hypothetical protein